MKKLFIITLLALLFFTTYGQNEKNKNKVLAKVGSNFSYNENDRLAPDGFSFELAYQREILKQLSLEATYTFIAIDNTPRGFSNDAQLNDYLLNSEIIFFSYEEQNTNLIGLNLHYSFINNNKWYASFYGGVGYAWFDINQVNLTGFTYDGITGEIVDVRWERTKKNENTSFHRFGFQVNYILQNKYVLGIQPSWTFLDDSDILNTSNGVLNTPNPYNPITSFLNLSLSFGYNF